MKAKRCVGGLLVVAMTAASFGAIGIGNAAAGAPPASCDPLVDFDARNFPDEARVDHTHFPMPPGKQLVFEGVANRGGGLLAHRVVFTTTSLVKVIDGVRTIVGWDVDINQGELAEAELAFFAQDVAGNVWNLGEYPEEYSGGVFTGAPSTWIAGQDGARGGVHMMADPQVGTPEYLQGDAPSVEFLDCAVVMEAGGTLCDPAACFDNVVRIHERSPLDPAGGIQTKAHAPGLGIIEIGAIGDPEGETLRLVEVNHLDAQALEDANQAALKLEAHAYEVNAAYRNTQPAERAGGSEPPPPPPPDPEPPGPPGVGGPPTPAPTTTPTPVPTTAAPSTPVRTVSGSTSVGRIARGELSLTGSNAMHLVLFAVVLLGIGSALVVFGRRTRAPRW